jgi:hypothetical protein
MQANIKGHKETFGGDGYVYYLDCGDGIMGICMSPNSSNGIRKLYIKPTQMQVFLFLCINYASIKLLKITLVISQRDSRNLYNILIQLVA